MTLWPVHTAGLRESARIQQSCRDLAAWQHFFVMAHWRYFVASAIFRPEAVRAALGRGNLSVRQVLVVSAPNSLTFGSGSLWRMSRFLGTKGHRAVTDSFQLPDQS